MKKRAFTLTELLVVVVIIGVLSAVVLPKFTKVLQTRKTTEAENIMAAVRNEQEARCMIGRNYTADTTKLAALPKATSKNYTYTLDAQGITATAKDGNYILQIPSYTDGRICCSGEGCDGLNKDYPKCGTIADLEAATCEAPEVSEPEPGPEPCNLTDYMRTCQEEGYDPEYTGSVTYTVNADCTGHTKTDTCTKSEPTQCDVEDPQIAEKKALCDDPDRYYIEGTWNMTTCSCVCPSGTTWEDGQGCLLPPCDVEDPQIAEKKALCDDPDQYYIEGTWNMATCSCVCPSGTTWQDGTGCVPTCDVKDPQIAEKKELCEDPSYSGTGAEGSWNMYTCSCDCDAGSTWQDGQGCVPACDRTMDNKELAHYCEQPLDPDTVPGTWSWEGPDACKCICPEGSTLSRHDECELLCPQTDDNLFKAQDCEDPQVVPGYAPVPGTWTWEGANACKCICPEGYTKDFYGHCVQSCTIKYGAWINEMKENCERGDGHAAVYWDAIGRWNEGTCSCICPSGTTMYPNGVCYDPRYQGKPNYDCGEALVDVDTDCGAWEDWIGDYDDYVDTLDGEYDWEDYDDGGDWDGW